MSTPTPQDAPEENGPSGKEALKRLSHPAMQAALNAICALIEDERSPDSSGEPPAPKQTGLTLETAKEICSKLLGVPYSPPGSMTVSGYIVTTEDYQFALDPDGINDFIFFHASKAGAQNEVSWLMEVQSDNGKDIPAIRPVRLEVRQAAQDLSDDPSATDDQEATTDATPEPDYVQHWWDLEFRRQIEDLADKFPGAQAHNGTSKPAPIPAQPHGTESRRLVERLVQDVASPDAPQRRNRLRGRRAAFVERLLLVIAVLAAAGLGYWIAYLAHVDAAYAHGRAEAAIDLRHIAELNASESGRIAAEAQTVAAEKDAWTLRAKAVIRNHLERARAARSEESPTDSLISLRIAGDILAQSHFDDEQLNALHDGSRQAIILELTGYLYPNDATHDVLLRIAMETNEDDATRRSDQ